MSLHWILALTLTLTWLHCLTTKPTGFTEEAFRAISYLQDITCDEPNATFYSPSGDEYIIQALNCSIQELKTVGEECFGKNSEKGVRNAGRLSHLIGLMLKNTSKQNNSTHWSCEGRSRVLPYHNFLENVKKLIQILNSGEY